MRQLLSGRVRPCRQRKRHFQPLTNIDKSSVVFDALEGTSLRDLLLVLLGDLGGLTSDLSGTSQGSVDLACKSFVSQTVRRRIKQTTSAGRQQGCQAAEMLASAAKAIGVGLLTHGCNVKGSTEATSVSCAQGGF